MKFYTQADFELNKKEKKKEWTRALVLMLPFFAFVVTGFAVRIEPIAVVGCIGMFSVFIFLYDLRLKPVIRFGRHLAEIHSGMTHKTLGTLVRLGSDPVYMDGIDFFEVILNVYEDLSEEGERRFLLDCTKAVPDAWVMQDVIVTSHGNFVLEAELASQGGQA